MKFSGSYSGRSGNNSPNRSMGVAVSGFAFAVAGSDSRRGEGLWGRARRLAWAATELLVQRAFGMDTDSCRALIHYAISRPHSVFTPFVFTPAPPERLSIRWPKTKLAPPFITPREEGGAIFFPPA